jgi:hypothetical protein
VERRHVRPNVSPAHRPHSPIRVPQGSKGPRVQNRRKGRHTSPTTTPLPTMLVAYGGEGRGGERSGGEGRGGGAFDPRLGKTEPHPRSTYPDAPAELALADRMTILPVEDEEDAPPTMWMEPPVLEAPVAAPADTNTGEPKHTSSQAHAHTHTPRKQ